MPGILVEKDFDISDEAGGVGKVIVKNYTVNVMNTLGIRLYWAGKGTINIPKEEYMDLLFQLFLSIQ
ncbi:probable leucine-rich repeat receptor-like serine/threonine-protein kinase, partial [Tanacetum coccineum]